jgi:hypothetical protein
MEAPFLPPVSAGLFWCLVFDVCPTVRSGAGIAVQAADAPPAWAYGFTTPLLPGTPLAEPNPQQVLDNVTLHSLPGSKISFTRAQIANRYGPADWFPEDHPAMPDFLAPHCVPEHVGHLIQLEAC